MSPSLGPDLSRSHRFQKVHFLRLSRRLLLDYFCGPAKPSNETLYRDAEHHQRLQPQKPHPDTIEQLFFVAEGVPRRCHFVEDDGIGALHEEEGFEDVEGEPNRPGCGIRGQQTIKRRGHQFF